MTSWYSREAGNPSSHSQRNEHTSVFVAYNGVHLPMAWVSQKARFGGGGRPRCGSAMAWNSGRNQAKMPALANRLRFRRSQRRWTRRVRKTFKHPSLRHPGPVPRLDGPRESRPEAAEINPMGSDATTKPAAPYSTASVSSRPECQK